MLNSGSRPILDNQAETLLEQAALAPSSHNTQPWYFRTSDENIELYADRTRALPVNDPQDRELLISCGCALFNLRIAAFGNGLTAIVALMPEPANEDLLATVSLDDKDRPQQEYAGLATAIGQRRTYRKRFQNLEVPKQLLTQLSAAAEQEGAWLETLGEGNRRQKIAELVTEGDAIQWADPSWRRELAAWMHPRRLGDGLTVPGFVAPIAQAVVRTFDMGNGVGAKDKQLTEESPVLAVLGSERDDKKAWLETGLALQHLLLEACNNGLQASYLNQPIQVATLRPRLQELLQARGFPQIILRLGFPAEELPATPRRPLADMIDRESSRNPD